MQKRTIYFVENDYIDYMREQLHQGTKGTRELMDNKDNKRPYIGPFIIDKRAYLIPMTSAVYSPKKFAENPDLMTKRERFAAEIERQKLEGKKYPLNPQNFVFSIPSKRYSSNKDYFALKLDEMIPVSEPNKGVNPNIAVQPKSLNNYMQAQIDVLEHELKNNNSLVNKIYVMDELNKNLSKSKDTNAKRRVRQAFPKLRSEERINQYAYLQDNRIKDFEMMNDICDEYHHAISKPASIQLVQQEQTEADIDDKPVSDRNKSVYVSNTKNDTDLDFTNR